MSFQETVVNPGSGGAKIASDTFTQGPDSVTLVYSGIAFGTLGGGSYQEVDSSHGLPAQIVAALPAGGNTLGGVTQSGPWSVFLGAGSSLIGQVELTDGTNVLGTSTHPVRTDPTGTTPQPVSLASLPALSAGSSLIGQVEVTDGTNVLGTSTHPVRTDPTGTTPQPVSLASLPALSAGSSLIGQVEVTDGTNVLGTSTHPLEVTVTNSGFAVVGSVTVVDSVALTVGGTVALSGGASNVGYFTPGAAGQTAGAAPFHAVSAASNNATSLKASAGTLWEMIAVNLNSSAPRYVKFYDVSGAPNPASDAVKYVVPLPTAGSANGAGAARQWPVGLKFSNGIGYAIVAGISDTDNTSIAANEVLLSGSYQ